MINCFMHCIHSFIAKEKYFLSGLGGSMTSQIKFPTFPSQIFHIVHFQK